MDKVQELVTLLKAGQIKEEQEKKINPILFVVAVVGAIVAVCGIAYAIYRHFSPDYLGEFDDDDFDDDFEDYFDDEDCDDFDEDRAEKEDPVSSAFDDDRDEQRTPSETKIIFPRVK